MLVNESDPVRRGRLYLNSTQVREIRNSPLPIQELSQVYRCGKVAIYRIRSGESYPEVPEDPPILSTFCTRPYRPSLEYMAALIDGEGCIGVANPFHKGRCCVHLTITQRYMLNILRAVHEAYGGKLYLGETHSSWKMNGEFAKEILQWVLPYLIGKAHQARIAIALQGKPYNHPRVVPWREELTRLKKEVLL